MNRLDEIKARLNEVGSHHPDVADLVAAVEAVLRLHTPKDSRGGLHPVECAYCRVGDWSDHALPVGYPCPTVTAIRAALGEEQ